MAIRILMLEDVEADAELIVDALMASGVECLFRRVDKRADFIDALEMFQPNVVLADYKLPAFDGLSAVRIVRQSHPEVPVVMVTGALGDEGAVELLQAGARDYVLKSNLKRLPTAVRRALAEEQGIRNRKLAEAKYRALFEQAREGIVLVDCVHGEIQECNPEFERICARPGSALTGNAVWMLAPPPQQEQGKMWFLEIREAPNGGSHEGVIERPDGSHVPVEFSAKKVWAGGECRIQAVVQDIGSRKQAERQIQLDLAELKEKERALQQSQARLERVNRALHTLSACNQLLIKAADETALLESLCRVIVQHGGYLTAWAGLARDDAQHTVTVLAASRSGNYLCRSGTLWADYTQGQGPTASAIRSGKTQVLPNIQTDPLCSCWLDAARMMGYHSLISVPLAAEGEVFGALTIVASEAHVFDTEEIRLLQEMGSDLAFGIATLRLRKRHDQTAAAHAAQAERIKKNLEDTISIIADTMEMRDPYTSGHEKRVARLAMAIAGEMGLPDDTMECLRVAGTVHDIGKVRVPAEILTKPGALVSVENDLVKLHAEAGYELLKSIDFPWPIARMVHEHHERLDGSGYPQGLKGGEILLESQILAVADVVEAMSSHRPYRSGLGIEAALNEIESNRGSRYNAEAVDACIRLFRMRQFSLTETPTPSPVPA